MRLRQRKKSKKFIPSNLTSASSSKDLIYDEKFYLNQIPGSERSAHLILSFLFKYFKPNSIIDVGCGAGTWLKAARNLGVNQVLGIDGDYAYSSLVINDIFFEACDLNAPIVKDKKFEMLFSLEVAEHLNVGRAEGFIADLCKISDVILFSAALPNQGGTDHRNENWPEYWAKYFYNNGYYPLDFIRDVFWNNDDVEWWYRQNILIFVTASSHQMYFNNFGIADMTRLTRIHSKLIGVK